MMKRMKKNDQTVNQGFRGGRLRKMLSGFLAMTCAVSMMSGNVSIAMADEASTEFTLAGAGSGQDVTVRFGSGENQNINLHINPETGALDESETLAGAFSQGEVGTETEAETEAETETDAETYLETESEFSAETEADVENIAETEAEYSAETEMEYSAETEADIENIEETETETEAKLVYTYEDGKVRVTATLQEAGAIPTDAKLRVTPVTPDGTGYNYDAYMQALNDNADVIAPSSAGDQSHTADLTQPGVAKMTGTETPESYNQSNTLLYDIAFIGPEYDEDGKPIKGSEVEYQPEAGSVNISIEFISNQLTEDINASEDKDVSIVHLPVSDSVKGENTTTADATNISAGDILVEKVDAQVSVDGGSADFNLDHFSVVAAVNQNNSVVRVNIAFQDSDGNAVSTQPDLDGATLYMFIRKTDGQRRIVKKMAWTDGVFTGIVSGFYDQNSGKNSDGSLYPFDSGAQYELTLFSYKGNYGESSDVDTNNENGKTFLRDGMVMGSYTLDLPDALSGRRNPVSAGYEYTAVASGFGKAGGDTFQSVLGDAVNYGIVTEYYYQDGGDAETNVAAYKAMCTTQTGNDVTNDIEQTFILAEVENKFLIKGFPAYVKVPADDASKVNAVGAVLTIDSSQTKAELMAEVKAMLDYTKWQSNALMQISANARIDECKDQKYCVDLSDREAGTYYVTVTDAMYDKIMGEADKLRIIKSDDQTVVFNVAKSGWLQMQKYSIGKDGSYIGSDSYMNTKEPVPQTIIWNMPNATYVQINGSVTGTILAHKAEVKVDGTSSGWLIAKKVTIGSGEWHNVYQFVKKISGSAILRASKTIRNAASSVSGFKFTLDYKDGDVWKEAKTETNDKSAVSFSELPCLTYSASNFTKAGTDDQGRDYADYFYRIRETAGSQDSEGNAYVMDTRVYYAKVRVTRTQSSNAEVRYTASEPQYYTDEACTIPIAENTLPTFDNTPSDGTIVNVVKNWAGPIADGVTGIKVQLFRNGEAVTGEDAVLLLNDENEWSGSFEGLDTSGENGQPYTYTVAELSPDGTPVINGGTIVFGNGKTAAEYQVSIQESQPKNFTITNTAPEKTNLTVKKVWDIEGSNIENLPTVQVNVYRVPRSGGSASSLNVNSLTSTPTTLRSTGSALQSLGTGAGETAGTNTGTQTNTGEKDTQETTAQETTVQETDPLQTNAPEPETVDLKTMITDSGTTTPTVVEEPRNPRVHVFGSGNDFYMNISEDSSSIKLVFVRVTDQWNIASVFDTMGADGISYRLNKASSVELEDRKDYYVSTYVSDPIALTKDLYAKWDESYFFTFYTFKLDAVRCIDGKSSDLTQAADTTASSTARLIDTLTLSASTGWEASLKDLPLTGPDGVEYEYYVEEVELTGFTSEYSSRTTVRAVVGDTEKTLYAPVNGEITITNHPEVTHIPVHKEWQDEHPENRPASITLKLMDGGTVVRTAEVTPVNGQWEYDFTELPKYRYQGETPEKIQYTVVEELEANSSYSSHVTVQTEANGDITSVQVVNTENASYSMPATGGEGTRMIYLMSMTLIALAGIGLIAVRRRREEAG